MKLEHLLIRNFRSCRELELDLGPIHALVGANNAGKSTVLRAVEMLINPSKRRISEESFWGKQKENEIRIEGIFGGLNEWEASQLAANLRADGRLQLARVIKWTEEPSQGGPDASDDEDDIGVTIDTMFCKQVPRPEWLRPGLATGGRIGEWWNSPDALVFNGHSFPDFVGRKKPLVGDWKVKVREFAQQFLAPSDYVEEWEANPQGYPGVLKGTLPFFVFIPAIRDIQEESKATKTSPFGRLLQAVLAAVPSERKTTVEQSLRDVAGTFNRSGGETRLNAVTAAEVKLNTYLRQVFSGCDLELEFQTPSFEELIISPKVFINDGFRGAVENKGHGVQRATIFAILQAYAALTVQAEGQRRKSLILAVEEPELYMHPQAQRTLRRVFADIAKVDQVFFATHSSFMVDVGRFEEIIRLESRIEDVAGFDRRVTTTARQLRMGALIEDLAVRFPATRGHATADSFREHYSHVYNPTRNEGFFAKLVILVEGNTEEYALPVYAESLGQDLDRQGISIIACGGKDCIDRLYRIFNELGIPSYVIFDYDLGNSDDSGEPASRRLLTWLGESADAPTTPVIGAKAAYFPQTWEVTSQAEISEYMDLTREARRILGIKQDTGKPLIARYIARSLSKRNPPFVPPSVGAMLRSASQTTWTGSCLRRDVASLATSSSII